MQTQTQTIRGQQFGAINSELERIHKTRIDSYVPVHSMGLTPEGQLAYVDENQQQQTAPLSNWSASQLSDFADMPRNYFTKLRNESSPLLARCVNHEIQKRREQVEKTDKLDGRIIRVYDNQVKALVSSRFFTLDSYEIMNSKHDKTNESVSDILSRFDFEIISSELTEKRFYIKATTKKIQGEVKLNDVVQFGVVISSSDVGAGSIMIEPFALRLVCLNGAIFQNRYRRSHLSSNQESNEVRRLYSADTLQKEKGLALNKIQEVLAGSLTKEVFDVELKKMQRATTLEIGEKIKPSELVGKVTDLFGIEKRHQDEIENHFVRGNQGAGLTLWGLSNSFTAAAKNDKLDYDSAITLERAAGELINMEPTQWRNIAKVH